MARTRDWRRAQRERVIERTREWMRANGYLDSRYRWMDDDRLAVSVRKNATTPHPCSGHCCGNPRKWFGEKTIQERRHD